MARLIYFRQGDDEQLPVTPSAPLNIEEDSDSWWAGVQRCFVAVPIAGTLAAIALSASLAFGYQQQTDEIVPQPAQIAVEDYWWSPSARIEPPASHWWVVDDDLPVAPAAFTPDEDFWLSPRIVSKQRWFPQVWIAQGDEASIPTFASEDYQPVYTPSCPLPRFVYLPDPEEIPAGFLFGVPEEDAWQPPVFRLVGPPIQPWVVDEEFPVAPAAFVPDEDYWLPPVCRFAYTLPAPWVVEDDFVGVPPPPLLIDEDYWLQPAPPLTSQAPVQAQMADDGDQFIGVPPTEQPFKQERFGKHWRRSGMRPT